MLRACKAFAVALIALSALVATGQSAASPFIVEAKSFETRYFTGEQERGPHEFLNGSLQVKCTTSLQAKNSEGETVRELTFFPSYSGCTTSEGATTDVKLNGCTYTFTTPSGLTSTELIWNALDLHLVCPEGKSVEITPTTTGVSTCTQFLSAQTPTEGRVVGTSKGGSKEGWEMDGTLAITFKGLHYTGTGGLCGDGTTHTQGEYRGNSTLRAFSNEAHTIRKGLTLASVPASDAWMTGDQDGGVQVFETPKGKVECTTVVWTAYSANSILSEITVTPSTSGCKAFGFSFTDVKVNACTYTFTTPTSLGAEGVTWSGEQFHLLCPTGKQIEITPTAFGASVCTQFLGPQTPTGGHIVGKNKGGAGAEMDVTLEMTSSGLHYTGTGSFCSDATTHTDGVLTGNSTLRGYSDEAHATQQSITVS